jgi:hypothetical protein
VECWAGGFPATRSRAVFGRDSHKAARHAVVGRGYGYQAGGNAVQAMRDELRRDEQQTTLHAGRAQKAGTLFSSSGRYRDTQTPPLRRLAPSAPGSSV